MPLFTRWLPPVSTTIASVGSVRSSADGAIANHARPETHSTKRTAAAIAVRRTALHTTLVSGLTACIAVGTRGRSRPSPCDELRRRPLLLEHAWAKCGEHSA